MLAELMHTTTAVYLLSLVISAIRLGLADLPLAPFLVAEAVGMPASGAALVLTAPRRGHGWHRAAVARSVAPP